MCLSVSDIPSLTYVEVMPPHPLLHQLFPRRDFDANAPAVALANQWSNPSNYAFTILLLLGGDVISRALAQLSGGLVTPVAFSFGTFQIFQKSEGFQLHIKLLYTPTLHLMTSSTSKLPSLVQ